MSTFFEHKLLGDFPTPFKHLWMHTIVCTSTKHKNPTLISLQKVYASLSTNLLEIHTNAKASVKAASL